MERGLEVAGLDQPLVTFPRYQGRPDLLLSETALSEEHAQALRHIRSNSNHRQRELHLDAAATHFQLVLLEAAKRIPKSIRQAGTPPFWNGLCQRADEACSLLYAQYAAEPTEERWSQYSQARRHRTATLAEQQRQLFARRVSKLDPARAADWNLVKSRDRGVDLRGTIIDGHAGLSAKANLFARRYSPPTPGPKLRLPRLASSPRVTPPEVAAALHKTQPAKAPGPDGIHPEFLKEGLGPRGLQYLTSLIDASVYTGYVPRHWKHAYWIPILKPNKPAEESGSYRPISLTSVISKVVERVMDTRIRAHPACQIDDRQHAFRRAHRTEDALARLVDTTNRSWNDAYVGKFGALKRNLRSSGRAAATLLDLNSAFDNLRHDRLHLQLRQQGFPAYITRWLMSFLTGRTAQVFVHGLTSRVTSAN